VVVVIGDGWRISRPQAERGEEGGMNGKYEVLRCRSGREDGGENCVVGLLRWKCCLWRCRAAVGGGVLAVSTTKKKKTADIEME
jgi:hypothetical protein